MTKTVAQKMGIKEKYKTIFINAHTIAIATIELPELVIFTTYNNEQFDYIHLFVKKK